MRVRRVEAAYRLVFVRPALERTPGILSVYGIASHFGAIYLCRIIQVWAKGMVNPPAFWRVKKDISMLIHQLISKS